MSELLAPYRVLDLAGISGALCGTILASMGADVICLEPPGGSPIRAIPPFLDDEPGPERSLTWWALAANKRSVRLDVAAGAQRAALHRLLEGADFLIESFPPGYLAGLSLSYDDIRERYPRLIFVSITPYGQTGPHASWAAADINLQAMGGHMYLTGDVDRPPLRVGVPAAYWHGGSEGAAAAMIALHARKRTGRGQHVDVSIQQCVIWTLLNTTMTWQLVRRQEMRGGGVRKERGNTVYTRNLWPCKDGLVQYVPIGGGGGAARSRAYLRFVQWMREEGCFDDALVAKDWNDVDMFSFTQAEYDAVAERILHFLATKRVSEVFDRSVRDRLLIAPVADVAQVLGSVQLAARGFFVDVDHPLVRRPVAYPGAFAAFSETPLRRPRPAPRLGEHDDEVLLGDRKHA